MKIQAEAGDPKGHAFREISAGEPERCVHCGLLAPAFRKSRKKIPCVPPEWRIFEKSEPDESDKWAAYHADSLAAKFFRSEDDTKSFLGADAGDGQNNRDQGWRGPIPILSLASTVGAPFDWESLNSFLPQRKIPPRVRSLPLKQKIDRTLNQMDGEPSCFLCDFVEIERDAIRREGHEYEGRIIKGLGHQMAFVVRDLLGSLRQTFPTLPGEAVADFLTSFNVFKHLRNFAERLKADPSLQTVLIRWDVSAALDFIQRQIASRAHTIRSQVESRPPAKGSVEIFEAPQPGVAAFLPPAGDEQMLTYPYGNLDAAGLNQDTPSFPKLREHLSRLGSSDDDLLKVEAGILDAEATLTRLLQGNRKEGEDFHAYLDPLFGVFAALFSESDWDESVEKTVLELLSDALIERVQSFKPPGGPERTADLSVPFGSFWVPAWFPAHLKRELTVPIKLWRAGAIRARLNRAGDRAETPGNAAPAGQQRGDGVQERAERRRAVVMPILAKKNWKRGKWATKAGVGKNSVYGYLNGSRSLSDANRKAMAEVLGLKPEQLPK